MAAPTTSLQQNIIDVLEETFERVHGIYLDKGTSFFETLEEVPSIVAELREEYATVVRFANDPATWDHEDAVSGLLAIAAHTAYHLGAVRQALTAIRARART